MMHWWKLISFCICLFTSVTKVKSVGGKDSDKYGELLDSFKLLMDVMREKDDKISSLENEARKSAGSTGCTVENTQIGTYVGDLQDVIQSLDKKLGVIMKGLAVEKSMRIDSTRSVELFQGQLQDMFAHFNLTLQHFGNSIKKDVETLQTNIEKQIDENKRLIESLTISVEKMCQCNSGTINLALRKPATESSTAISGPQAATDGRYENVFDEGSCTHTHSQKNPWWQVNLMQKFLIKRVVITNRGDCCGERLHDFSVTVANKTNGVMETCGWYKGPSTSGAVETILCDHNVYGQFVKIQIHSDDPGYLTLCEVEVYSR